MNKNFWDGRLNMLMAKVLGHDKQMNDIAKEVMKPIYTTSLSSAVNAVTISTDNLGANLNLSRLQLRIIVPAGCTVPTASIAYLQARINDIASGYKAPGDGTESGTYATMANIRNIFANVCMDIDVICSTGVNMKCLAGSSDGTTRTTSTYIASLISGVSSISKIYLYLTGGYTLPVGTMIELWGATL